MVRRAPSGWRRSSLRGVRHGSSRVVSRRVKLAPPSNSHHVQTTALACKLLPRLLILCEMLYRIGTSLCCAFAKHDGVWIGGLHT